MKVAEGFAAANSMIWRQSPSANTVEQNGITRILWIMQRAIKHGSIKRHGWRFMGLGGLSGISRPTVGGFNSRPPFQSWSPSIFATAGRWSKTPENFCDSPRCVGGVGFN